MSRLIDNALGTFNVVDKGGEPAVLFLCPDCGEWLPLADAHLSGEEVVDHESRREPGRFCTYQGSREFGASLHATMLSRALAGFSPTRPESLPPMYVPGEW